MDKLTAAQRRFGMTDREMNPGAARPFFTRTEIEKAGREKLERLGFHTGGYVSQRPEACKLLDDPFIDEALKIERTTQLQLEVLALQELLNEKDAEIDRLTQPTKWWLVLGWVIMAGTVIGVIAGVYDAIT